MASIDIDSSCARLGTSGGLQAIQASEKQDQHACTGCLAAQQAPNPGYMRKSKRLYMLMASIDSSCARLGTSGSVLAIQAMASGKQDQHACTGCEPRIRRLYVQRLSPRVSTSLVRARGQITRAAEGAHRWFSASFTLPRRRSQAGHFAPLPSITSPRKASALSCDIYVNEQPCARHSPRWRAADVCCRVSSSRSHSRRRRRQPCYCQA
jgi:hypothetical protein